MCFEESRTGKTAGKGKIMERKVVSIVMGSDSDLPVMKQAAEMLEKFGIGYELDIVSAHRTPEKLFDFASGSHKRGIEVIIAGAGGAAHLPGMIAAISPLPVIGVPIKSSNSIDGWDSVLSILQMPGGVPVASVALNGAKNAGILAAQILSVSDNSIRDKILQYKHDLKEEVIEKAGKLKLQ
jgi:5-(carboxyamino)imidazole ribonucleotide mutase